MNFLTNKKTKKTFPIHQTGKVVYDELDDKAYQHLYKETGKRKNCLTPKGGFRKFDKAHYDKTGQFPRVEAVCGGSSNALNKYLQNKYGKEASKMEYGFYVGHGKEHSEDAGKLGAESPSSSFKKIGGVDHIWVRLADGSIMDGARGQFIKDNLKKEITPQERTKIIHPMSPEQGAYRKDNAVEVSYNYANPNGMKR